MRHLVGVHHLGFYLILIAHRERQSEYKEKISRERLGGAMFIRSNIALHNMEPIISLVSWQNIK